MSSVYLNQPWLESSLAGNLAASAQQFSNNIKPQAQPCKSSDGAYNIGFFYPVAGTKVKLAQRINRIVNSCLPSCNDSFADCLLILASTSQAIQEIEEKVIQEKNFNSTHVYKLDLFAETVKKAWGFASALSLNTACTSAANALIYGARLVKEQAYKKVLVIAYETPSELALQGFGSLGLNSMSGNYRPFHPERDGLILGEAYAATLITQEKTTSSYAKLLGGGSGCDTSNMTSTQVDGSHIHATAELALEEAGVKVEQIDLIKHHGTGTDNNDLAEAAAFERTFLTTTPASCCLKPWLGHTLGACGLAEVILMMYCISNKFAFPAIDYAAEAITPLSAFPLELPLNSLVLANFSGFGGNNASLVLQGVEQ